MWTEHDRRLAQVLLQARVLSPDDLHQVRDLQEASTDGDGHRPTLAEILIERGLLTEDELRPYLRSCSVPHDPDKTNPLTKAGGRPPVTAGRNIGGYEVICSIASGASGTVYKARDSKTQQLIALKILSSVGASKRGAERFLREAQVACALRHENLTRGYRVGRINGLYYFAMELVEGESVGARLRREGRLPEGEVVAIGRACCRALDSARKHGVVHRDVKPDNILIDTEGNVKLCDLGLARPFGRPSNVTESGIAVGTPRYIAPEQAKGDPRVDHRADIYSLGITLFHLATGEVPFDGESGLDVITKHIYEEMPSVREQQPELSVELDYVIRRATRKRPQKRYETAGDMGRDLDVTAQRLVARARKRSGRTGMADGRRKARQPRRPAAD